MGTRLGDYAIKGQNCVPQDPVLLLEPVFLLEIMFRPFHCWCSAVLQEPILESCEEDLKVN